MKSKPKKIEPLLTQADVAKILRVTTWTVWSMRRRGMLPDCVIINRRTFWEADSVREFIEERKTKACRFDPVLCERSQKALKAKQSKKIISDKSTERRGRPTKAEKIESINFQKRGEKKWKKEIN